MRINMTQKYHSFTEKKSNGHMLWIFGIPANLPLRSVYSK